MTLHPLFLDQTEAQRAEKIFLIPPPLSQGLDDRAPPYLKVLIRYWISRAIFRKTSTEMGVKKCRSNNRVTINVII